MLVTVAKRSNP